MTLSDTIADNITAEVISDVLMYTSDIYREQLDGPDYGQDGRSVVKAIATLKRIQLRLDGPTGTDPRIFGRSVVLMQDREFLVALEKSSVAYVEEWEPMNARQEQNGRVSREEFEQLRNSVEKLVAAIQESHNSEPSDTTRIT